MAGIRQFDEEKLLEQAINTFWRKGYTATSMIDLAKETGVQRGSLYHAYQNKNTLFIKAFEQYSQTFLTTVRNVLEVPCARDAFAALFDLLLKRLIEDKDKKGCFSTRTIMEASQESPAIGQQLRDFIDGFEHVIACRLEQAQQHNQFAADPRTTAQYVVAMTRGAAVIERIYDDGDRVRQVYQTTLEQLAITPLRS